MTPPGVGDGTVRGSRPGVPLHRGGKPPILFSPLRNGIARRNGSRTEAAMPSAPSEVTGLLQRWSAGDPQARDQLIPLVYDRLRELAHRRLRRSPREHSLNTTALVHETYLRLVDAPEVDLPDRAHFLALAAQVMRNLLLDHARARAAAKRGGGKTPVELDEALWMSDEELD